MTNSNLQAERVLCFIGYGDFSKQIHELFFLEVRRTVICDDVLISHSGEIYPFEAYKTMLNGDYAFVVGLGYHHLKLRKTIIDDLLFERQSLPTVVHASSVLASTSVLKEAVTVFPGCIIDIRSVINAGSILHNAVTVSHDAQIGSCCYLSPGVVLAGNVHIGDCTFIGAGAIIRDGVRIGSNARVAMGTVVTSDVEDNASAIGNPMRITNRPLVL